MRNTKRKKIKLHVEREILHVLEGRELAQVEGGVFDLPRVTGNSRRVCCV